MFSNISNGVPAPHQPPADQIDDKRGDCGAFEPAPAALEQLRKQRRDQIDFEVDRKADRRPPYACGVDERPEAQDDAGEGEHDQIATLQPEQHRQPQAQRQRPPRRGRTIEATEAEVQQHDIEEEEAV